MTTIAESLKALDDLRIVARTADFSYNETQEAYTRLKTALSRPTDGLRLEWQPIETAPLDGQVVWVAFWEWNRPDTERGVVRAGYSDGTWQQYDAICEVWPPTHWMPYNAPTVKVPAPPPHIPTEVG